MIFLNIIFLNLLLIDVRINSESICPTRTPFLHYRQVFNPNKTWSIFSGFKQFSQISRDCLYNVTNHIEFIPDRANLLDESFDAERLFLQSQLSEISYVVILNLKGVDIHLKPWNLNFTKSHLHISSSALNAYSHGKLIESSACNSSVYNNDVNFLNSFYAVNFANVKYPPRLCPYVFKLSTINQITFGDITDSYLKRNLLIFSNVDDDFKMESSSFKSLIFYVNYVFFDSRLLNKLLFKDAQIVCLQGLLSGIQSDLFKEFSHLQILT